jgi:hypothetical protein
MLFLESKRVAVEVGSGCSVFVENTAGFEDNGVLNTWKGDDMYYRNFICLSSARIGKPVELAPVRMRVQAGACAHPVIWYLHDATVCTTGQHVGGRRVALRSRRTAVTVHSGRRG